MSAPAAEPCSAYDDFAWFYHRYWSQGIPFRLLDTVDRLLLADVEPGARVLDLCCGTGRISRALADRGFRVTGVDGSAGMLEFARAEAPGVEFVRADARDFAVDEPVDAVVSLFDSLNHVTGPGELARVFRCVHTALRARCWRCWMRQAFAHGCIARRSWGWTTRQDGCSSWRTGNDDLRAERDG